MTGRRSGQARRDAAQGGRHDWADSSNLSSLLGLLLGEAGMGKSRLLAELAANPASHTGRYLAPYLAGQKV